MGGQGLAIQSNQQVGGRDFDLTLTGVVDPYNFREFLAPRKCRRVDERSIRELQ